MALQKQRSETAAERRNNGYRGKGEYSMRGELKKGISMNRKRLNRKVRHDMKSAMKHGDYRKLYRTVHMVNFS